MPNRRGQAAIGVTGAYAEPMVRTLSVVVPCYNESAVLPELCSEVFKVATGLADEVELVIVDDGSSDDTFAVAARIANHDARVRVLGFSRNFGKEAAIRAGLDAARGDAVVLMDADMQHPPHLIADLVERHEAGADQVVARRTRDGDPKLRSGLARWYYRLVNRVTDVSIEDGVGDFRLMSRPVVNALLEMDEVNRFSKGLFNWVGFRVDSVDYVNVPRSTGSSTWSFKTLFNYGLDGILSFNNKPLRASLWLGAVAVSMSILYVLWLLAQFFIGGVDAPGYITTITVVVFLGGIQLMFLGIIGEYVGRIYYETKRRPHFIVAHEINRPRS